MAEDMEAVGEVGASAQASPLPIRKEDNLAGPTPSVAAVVDISPEQRTEVRVECKVRESEELQQYLENDQVDDTPLLARHS